MHPVRLQLHETTGRRPRRLNLAIEAFVDISIIRLRGTSTSKVPER